MKRFSIVTIFGNSTDEDEELFLPGFCNIEDLSSSSVFFEIMCDIPASKTVDIEIEHCYLLEKPCPEGELTGKEYARDIMDADIDDLMDNFDILVEEDRVYCEDTIFFDLEGLDSNEVYVEEVVSLEEEGN